MSQSRHINEEETSQGSPFFMTVLVSGGRLNPALQFKRVFSASSKILKCCLLVKGIQIFLFVFVLLLLFFLQVGVGGWESNLGSLCDRVPFFV